MSSQWNHCRNFAQRFKQVERWLVVTTKQLFIPPPAQIAEYTCLLLLRKRINGVTIGASNICKQNSLNLAVRKKKSKIVKRNVSLIMRNIGLYSIFISIFFHALPQGDNKETCIHRHRDTETLRHQQMPTWSTPRVDSNVVLYGHSVRHRNKKTLTKRHTDTHATLRTVVELSEKVTNQRASWESTNDKLYLTHRHTDTQTPTEMYSISQYYLTVTLQSHIKAHTHTHTHTHIHTQTVIQTDTFTNTQTHVNIHTNTNTF